MERLQALELKLKSMESAEWDENQRLRATIDSQQKVIDYLENKGRLRHGRIMMYLEKSFALETRYRRSGLINGTSRAEFRLHT